jgi:TRAP-type C4-dicarboxylate transport system permease small subunit
MKFFYQYVLKAEVYIAMAALAILSALVLFSAIARSIGTPVKWAIDAATFLFAWCVFLGADIAMRNDKLFSIEVLTCKLPKICQYYLKLINNAIVIAFLSFLIVYGLKLSYTTRLRTFQGIPDFSYTWVTLAVPVGCLLMLITTVLKIRQQIRAGYENTQCTGGGKELL